MHNYFKSVARILNIKINKPFKVNVGGGRSHILKLTNEDLYILIDNAWQLAYGLTWNNILNGKWQIIKED